MKFFIQIVFFTPNVLSFTSPPSVTLDPFTRGADGGKYTVCAVRADDYSESSIEGGSHCDGSSTLYCDAGAFEDLDQGIGTQAFWAREKLYCIHLITFFVIVK